MKRLLTFRLVARVLLSLVGGLLALAVTVGLGPAGCGRGAFRALVPTDTIRAAKLLRLQHPVAAPVVLAPGTGWQLMQVRRVVDGDTYEVQPATGGGRARLRLTGVDCPERDQPFGAQATDSVQRLLLGRYAWVRVLGGDQYGRNLAAVRLRPAAFSRGPGRALDSLLVVRGWAWAYAPAGQTVAWATQQQQAQAARRGLWKCGTNGVVRPGSWRGYTRQDKASAGGGCAW